MAGNLENINCDAIMDLGGDSLVENARLLLEMAEKEELLSKYKFPTTTDSKGYYRIYVRDVTRPKGLRQLRDRNLDNLKQRVYEYEKGLHGEQIHITFADAFKRSQAFHAKNAVGDRKYSVSNTLKRNETEYRRYFGNTAFERMYLQDIKVKDLDDMIRTNLRKRPTTAKGLASIRAIVNATYQHAYFNEWISDNSASRIIWKNYADMLVQPAKISNRVYSDDELDQIELYLHARQNKQPDYIPAYAEEWQFITAMRRGEVAPLRWDSIDTKRLCIHVDSEQITVKGTCGCENSNKLVPYTKNGIERDYPLADMEQEFLSRLWKVHETYYPDSPYLFPAHNENGRITNDTVYQFHRRMLRKLNIPVSREFMRGTHAFRRTRISQAAAASNGNLQMVSLIYGNSPETIRNHYLVDNDLERKRHILNTRAL